MLTIRLLVFALSLGNTGCSTDSVTGPMSSQPSVGVPESAQMTTLNGFVELYRDEPAYLLSGGIEIPLAGATDLVVPHGGLQVTVSGRYLSTGTFLVEAVSPQLSQRLQAMGPDKAAL